MASASKATGSKTKGGGRQRSDRYQNEAPTQVSLQGREPPYNLDAEAGLLASLMLEDGHEVLTQCIEAHIVAETFYKPAHQLIYQSALDLYNEGKPVDIIILQEHLRNKGELEGAGGMVYLGELSSRIETTTHSRYWMEIVREKYLLRRLIRTSIKTAERCYEERDNLDQFIADVEEEIFRISQDRITDAAQHIRQPIEEAVNTVQTLLQRKDSGTGVMSGFRDLDGMTFGFQQQEMIVLAARPSVGKTSFAMNVVEAVICPRPNGPKPVPTLVFSLEMSSTQLALRMLCGRARVDMKKVRNGYLGERDQKSLADSARELQKAPLWIDESGHINILEMRAKARRLQAKQPDLGLVIIDYLQLVSGTDNSISREQQIAEISRGIKAMAKELKLPVIVLSQLNRESEKEKRDPRLSDLRESGSIEQDADVVLLLHRTNDRINKEDDGPGEVDGALPGDVDNIKLIIAKQRNGPVGYVPLIFRRGYTRFENYTPDVQAPYGTA
jgi:replicative DNA helicase